MAADGSVIIEIDGDDSKLNKTLGNVKKTASGALKVAGISVAGVTAALGGAAAYAVKVGSNFEASMSNVAAISGATGNELEALTEKAKEMGRTTKFSASESADALSYMAMAGWKTEDMLGGIEGVMNLAAASGEDLATTSDIVTDAMTAFGMAANESGRFADVLAAAASNSNTNVGMMGDTFRYVAPVAGALGYSVEDTAVAIGLMANAGIKGSQAGTALRSMLTNLAKPSEQVSGYLTKLGISLTDSAGQVKPLNVLLSEMRGKFDGLTEAQKAEYAAGIAGQEGMSGLLAIVNASDADFQKLTASINGSSGAAEAMAKTMNDNLKGAMAELESGIEGLGISAYESMEKPLKKAVQSTVLSVGKLQRELTSNKTKAAIETLADGFGDLVSATADFAAGAIPVVIEGAAVLADNMEYVALATGAAALSFAGFKVSGIISSIALLSTEVGILTAGETAQTIATAISTGALTAKETVIGVLTGKIKLATVAQAAWDAVMAASPIGLAVTAVAVLTAGIVGLSLAMDDETRAEREQAEAIRDRNLAWEDTKQRTQDNIDAAVSEISVAEVYIDELRSITDENGKVKAGYEGRAAALYELINNAIPGAVTANQTEEGSIYKISDAIEDVIAKKKAQAVLSAMDDRYAEAIQNVVQAELDVAEAEQRWNEARLNGSYHAGELYQDFLNAKERAREYYDTISQYETVAASMSQGTEAINAALDSVQTNLKRSTNATAEELQVQADTYNAAYQNMAAEVASGSSSITEAQLARMRGLRDEANAELQAALSGQTSLVEQASGNMLTAMLGNLGKFSNAGTEKAKSFIDAFLSKKGDANKAATDVTKSTADGINSAASHVRNAADRVGGEVVTRLKTFVGQSRKSGVDLGAGVSGGLSSTSGMAASAAGAVLSTVTDRTAKAKPELTTGGKSLGTALSDGLKGTRGQAILAMFNVVNSAKGAAERLVPNMTAIGRNLSLGVAAGIRSGSGYVNLAMRQVVRSAINAGKAEADIHSPSVDTEKEIGKNLGLGVAVGLQKTSGVVCMAARQVVTYAVNAGKSTAMSSAKEVGVTLAEDIAAGISVGKNFVLQAQKELFDNILASSKHLVEVVNGELSRMQEVIQKRQADKELADHKKAIEEKYRELGKAEKKEKQKILDDIAELEADWNDKQLQAKEAAQQKALQATISGIEAVQKEYESARDAIQRDIESLSEKLADNGGLFTRDKDGYLSINNLKDQRAEIERYGQVLDDLKKRGASQEFLSEITAMGVEDGLAFAEKLAKMGEKQLETYLADWEAVQAASRLVAEKFYADQVETVDKEFSAKLAEEVGKIPESMKSVGIDSIQGLIDGMLSMESTLSATAAAIVRQAINAMQMEADIHSPSKKTRDLVGKPMGQGVGVGFKEALPDMMRQARAVIEQHTAQLSAFAAAKANAGNNLGGASEVRTYYQRERIENTPSLNFTGDLAALMRILYPHWENEYKRRGRKMITGGAMA